IAALDTYPDLEACHFKFTWIDETGAITRTPETITQVHFDLYQEANQHAHIRSGLCEFFMHFLYRNLYMTITSLVFRQSVIAKLAGFTSRYGVVGDYDWTMRLGLVTDVLYLPELLATWRVYPGQATGDCASPQVTEALLAIGKANLGRGIQSDLDRPIKQPIDQKQLLSDLHKEHAASLYKRIRQATSIAEVGSAAYLALKPYPLYPVQKLLRRLSGNRFYSYHPEKAAIALEWIEHYGLLWPPLKVGEAGQMLPHGFQQVKDLNRQVTSFKSPPVYK
ncbi:MAG: hypothetical protein WCA35_28190, partial [Kovacikia sp.]